MSTLKARCNGLTVTWSFFILSLSADLSLTVLEIMGLFKNKMCVMRNYGSVLLVVVSGPL